MELRKYLGIIFAHRKLIVFLALVTVVVATIGGFSKQPVYEATTTVLIKSDLIQAKIINPGFRIATEQSLQRKGKTFGQILKSRTIAEKIVSILGADKILNKKKLQKKQNQSRIVSSFKGIISIIKEFIDFLKYGKVKKQKRDLKQKVIKRVQGSISTVLILRTSIIKISVQFSDAQIAADIANTAASVFVNHLKEMNSAEARIEKEFIAQRVKVALGDLQKAQDAFRQFILEGGSVYPERKTFLTLTELVHFETSLKNAEAETNQISASLYEIHKKLEKFDKTSKFSITTIVNPLIQELKTKLVNSEIQRSNLSVDFGPLHPRVLAVEEEIKKIKANLKTEVKRIVQSEVTTANPIYQKLLSDLISNETSLKVQQAKRKAIAQILKNFPKDLKKWAEKQIDWDTFSGLVSFAQKNLDSLKLQLESARIKEAQKISEIKIIDQAIPPLNPKGIPKVAYTFLGFIVGLIGGIGLAFFMEYIDDSVQTIETIEEKLKLPVYGVIPEIKLQRKVRRKTNGLKEKFSMKEKLITHYEQRSPITEAYRSLRTNIQFCGVEEKNKIFLFTSSLKGEGKTTTVANISINTAQLGNKTLLIDADLINPMICSIFGKGKELGLSNYLGGSAHLNKIIIPSGIENLDIIPSGSIPPNSSELLSSKRLSELLNNVKKDYDFIFFDTPPVLAVTDATILSSKVHGVFLTIKGGQTSKRICLRAITLLKNVNANIIGAVLNKVKIEGRHGYEYYYQYYSGEKKRKKKSKI